MRSRSARCWSRAFGRSALLAALATVALGVSQPAGATVFSQPVSFGGPWIVNGTPWVLNANMYNGGTAYYAVTGGTYGSAFPDQGIALYNLASTQSGDSPPLANSLKITVESDNGALVTDAGSIMVLTVQVGQSGAISGGTSTTGKLAPIGGINGAACANGQNCYSGVGSGVPNLPGGFSYAVPYVAGAPVTISLYPTDICNSFLQQAGVSAGGCNAATPAVTSATVTPMALTFNIYSQDVNGNINQTRALDSGTLTLSFENTPPTFNCPDLSNIYVPGDGSIIVDTSGLASAPVPFLAPVVQAVVAATSKASAPDLTAAGFSTNEVIDRTSFGPGQVVSGFVNKTSEDDTSHDYHVALLVRDAAGLLQPTPSNVSSCEIGPGAVETSAIQGFLSKSNCFIATAAFRSIDSAPVAMLRRFRDSILLHSTPGRFFVHEYYHYSPPAAVWLMRHPVYRQPVLLALVPVEIVAWLALHPAGLLIPILAWLGLLAWAVGRRLLRRHEGARA